jgi:hypothetical protein
MGISYLIVMLALSSVQYESTERHSTFMVGRTLQRQASVPLLAAGGNPWAAPIPGNGRSQSFAQQAPAMPMNQPRYVTPEELGSLERKPEQLVPKDWNWAPLNMEGFGSGRDYGSPGYNSGDYGRGNYPGNSSYGQPPVFGGGSMMNPYGGPPYGDSYFEELMPFMY